MSARQRLLTTAEEVIAMIGLFCDTGCGRLATRMTYVDQGGDHPTMPDIRSFVRCDDCELPKGAKGTQEYPGAPVSRAYNDAREGDRRVPRAIRATELRCRPKR